MRGGFWTLAEGAAHPSAIGLEMARAPYEIVEEGCVMVETEAKSSLGSYHRGWPRLQPEAMRARRRATAHCSKRESCATR
jgi:hypothetical protein